MTIAGHPRKRGPHSDLSVLREWDDTNEPEPVDGWEWPRPPRITESIVEGQMRVDILNRIGASLDDTSKVRLIETHIEGGYSDATVEWSFDIEVWLDTEPLGPTGRRAVETRRVWQHYDAYSTDSAIAALIKWVSQT